MSHHFGYIFYCSKVLRNFISPYYVKFYALQYKLKIGISEAFGKFQIGKIEKIFVIFRRILGKKNFQDHQNFSRVELPQGTCNPRENYLIPERSFLTVFLTVETLDMTQKFESKLSFFDNTVAHTEVIRVDKI